ncbi:SMI1/KNR4 family protein [Synergistales bacterium]|nr:SMI1/KNR4 family protein [Synergistales bacterium]
MTSWRYVKPIQGKTVLDQLEKDLGIKFPKSYVDCAVSNNGGRPPQSKINDDLTIKSLVHVDDSADTNILTTWAILKDRLPSKCVPFASDSFGNYFCFDFSASGEPPVVFWDHEKMENAIEPVVDSFEKFVAMLQ